MARVDLSLLAGSATTATFTGLGDLTDDAVSAVVQGAVTYVEGAGVTVPAPRTAGSATVRFDSDDIPVGSYAYELRVLPAGANDHEVGAYGTLLVVDLLDPALAAMRNIIGSTVPPTDAELLAAYGRLGDAKAVVLEYLERLLLELVRQPTSWAVQGYSEDWGGSISGLRQFVRALRSEVEAEAGVGGSVMTVSRLVRDQPRR